MHTSFIILFLFLTSSTFILAIFQFRVSLCPSIFLFSFPFIYILYGVSTCTNHIIFFTFLTLFLSLSLNTIFFEAVELIHLLLFFSCSLTSNTLLFQIFSSFSTVLLTACHSIVNPLSLPTLQAPLFRPFPLPYFYLPFFTLLFQHISFFVYSVEIAWALSDWRPAWVSCRLLSTFPALDFAPSYL